MKLALAGTFWLQIKEWFIEAFSNIKFGNIIILITGIIIGFVLFTLVYTLSVLISFNKKTKQIKETGIEISEESVKKIIDDACQKYKDDFTTSPVKEKISGTKVICLEVINDIAKLYFPKSKHPALELTIDETILLIGYINKRIDELFSARGLKMFRSYRISQIQSLVDAKKKIDSNRAVRAVKDSKVSFISKIGRSILNALNPGYWLYKAVFNPAIMLTVNKMACVVIRIAGEEAYKVYNKSALHEEKEVMELIEEISSELEQ